MDWQTKVAALEDFYGRSFLEPRFVAAVSTSGSYGKKIRALARLGQRSAEEVEILCRQVDHLRRSFKIMDDVIDEDVIRDEKPAYWCVHGVEATIEQAAWEVSQARTLARKLGTIETFELRLCQVIGGARLEVEMEDSDFVAEDPPSLWWQIVEKEAAFRRYLAEALDCSERVIEAAWLDGVAAQVLDDSLSAQYGKDGRPIEDNSDDRLGRLTYMRAFGVSAKDAEAEGRRRKAEVAPILTGEGRQKGENGF